MIYQNLLNLKSDNYWLDIALQRKPLNCRKSLTNFIAYVLLSTPRHQLDSNSQLATDIQIVVNPTTIQSRPWMCSQNNHKVIKEEIKHEDL